MSLRFFLQALFACSLVFAACKQDTTEQTNKTEEPTEQSPENVAPRNATGISSDYENTDRVIWQKPEVVIELLGDLSGKTVADIGAGTGFFSRRLMEKADKVIAIDIDPRFVAYLDSVRIQDLAPEQQNKLEPRLVQPNNPMLTPQEVNAVLIVNTFMYIQNRIDYLNLLKKGLRPGGRLLMIDFKKKITPVGPPYEIRVPLFQVEEELQNAGFRIVSSNDTSLEYQYIVLAEL